MADVELELSENEQSNENNYDKLEDINTCCGKGQTTSTYKGCYVRKVDKGTKMK